MKKLLLSLLLIPSMAFAWTQRAPLPVEACQVHSPYGWSQNSKSVYPICREAYLVAYDPAAKLPNYVAYTLTPEHAVGCVARSNAFVSDQSVQNGATPSDYVGTGYDKGHMAPDGDLSWDQQVEYESFLMTNMSPQVGSLNRGIWKLLETSVRAWVTQRNQSYTIYVGSIYSDTDKKIGKGVVVPHAFYKIVVNNVTHEVAGWKFPHEYPYQDLGTNLTLYRTPISQIQNEAGVNFSYPQDAREITPGTEWPVNYGTLIDSKRNTCSIKH